VEDKVEICDSLTNQVSNDRSDDIRRVSEHSAGSNSDCGYVVQLLSGHVIRISTRRDAAA